MSSVAQLELRSESLADLQQVAQEIITFGKAYPVWLFEGAMGAGKTTLIKAICQMKGVEDTVSSPTFSLVNEYLTRDQELLYHFDFYRIDEEEEALDIGIDEYFYSGNYCFVEWPSKIEGLWPAKHLQIEVIPDSNSNRLIKVSQYGE
ncbi:tRNA (adenosine(37)-N6)-threonylcarbamoyltransferase complex ATPase subunit type 1 TsaE [Rapidithrix thailandica]|uniref:tRNA threonylcarbamoyladenosine biosynthesis protein TsaE n=1 Tax=Rapidithrix thailandica TaxID=413964 RepID=A0AAW9S304_9BACT